MKVNTLVISVLVAVLLAACQSPKVSVSDSYDGERNQTTVDIIPFGQIVIPGLWTRTHFEASNNSQELVDTSGTRLNVTLIPKKHSLFPSFGMNDKEFVTSSYQLESEGCLKAGLTSKVVAENPDDNFIIWMLTENENQFYLIGAKNSNAYIFTISNELGTNRGSLATEEKVEFLKALYLKN